MARIHAYAHTHASDSAIFRMTCIVMLTAHALVRMAHVNTVHRHTTRKFSVNFPEGWIPVESLKKNRRKQSMAFVCVEQSGDVAHDLAANLCMRTI